MQLILETENPSANIHKNTTTMDQTEKLLLNGNIKEIVEETNEKSDKNGISDKENVQNNENMLSADAEAHKDAGDVTITQKLVDEKASKVEEHITICSKDTDTLEQENKFARNEEENAKTHKDAGDNKTTEKPADEEEHIKIRSNDTDNLEQEDKLVLDEEENAKTHKDTGDITTTEKPADESASKVGEEHIKICSDNIEKVEQEDKLVLDEEEKKKPDEKENSLYNNEKLKAVNKQPKEDHTEKIEEHNEKELKESNKVKLDYENELKEAAKEELKYNDNEASKKDVNEGLKEDDEEELKEVDTDNLKEGTMETLKEDDKGKHKDDDKEKLKDFDEEDDNMEINLDEKEEREELENESIKEDDGVEINIDEKEEFSLDDSDEIQLKYEKESEVIKKDEKEEIKEVCSMEICLDEKEELQFDDSDKLQLNYKEESDIVKQHPENSKPGLEKIDDLITDKTEITLTSFRMEEMTAEVKESQIKDAQQNQTQNVEIVKSREEHDEPMDVDDLNLNESLDVDVTQSICAMAENVVQNFDEDMSDDIMDQIYTENAELKFADELISKPKVIKANKIEEQETATKPVISSHLQDNLSNVEDYQKNMIDNTKTMKDDQNKINEDYKRVLETTALTNTSTGDKSIKQYTQNDKIENSNTLDVPNTEDEVTNTISKEIEGQQESEGVKKIDEVDSDITKIVQSDLNSEIEKLKSVTKSVHNLNGEKTSKNDVDVAAAVDNDKKREEDITMKTDCPQPIEIDSAISSNDKILTDKERKEDLVMESDDCPEPIGIDSAISSNDKKDSDPSIIRIEDDVIKNNTAKELDTTKNDSETILTTITKIPALEPKVTADTEKLKFVESNNDSSDQQSQNEKTPGKSIEREVARTPLIKLSLNILSDEEDEPDKPNKGTQSREKDVTEKHAINLDDDDDIMVIEEETSKTDKKEPAQAEVVEKEDASLPKSDTQIQTVDPKDAENKEPEIEAEVNKVTAIPEPGVEEDVPMPEVKKAVEPAPERSKLVPDDFFKKYRKSLADMSRDEIEEFCILKIVEGIIEKSTLNEIRLKLKTMAQTIEEYKKKTMTLTKQNRDLQVVLKSVQEEQKKSVHTQPITPLKITRSVGMQVLMTDKNRRRTMVAQAGPANIKAVNNMNQANNRNVRNSPQSPRVTPQKVPNQPNIPVPRLVPAGTNPKVVNVQQNVNVAKQPVQNGIKNTPPPASKPEKRTHNHVTVDLTDDEPPPKVPNKASPVPPVRLVNQQNLLAPRAQMNQAVNSPRKVYIPISLNNPQTPSIRPGQAVMLKTVSAPGPRPRAPAPPVVRAPQTVPMRRMAARHPAPLPDAMKQYQPPNWKALPPAPDLKLSKVENGIVISWKIEGYQEDSYEEIASYQLYAYQETSAPPSTALWKKIGDVKALPLPMACTLTQFMAGYKYYFAVRAVDIRSRLGPFSLPGSILLLNKM